MTRDELLALIDQAAEEGWKELDLSGKGLTELPAAIGKLTQLETLILGKVEKREWQDGKPVLTLITNQLATLPNELTALKNLKSLNLSGNPLKVIPEVVFQLQSLEVLHLVSVGLSEVPHSLIQLPNLTTLFLDSNQITQIPEAIAQLTNLTTLSLYSNQITQIPEAIAQLTNLTRLFLDSNQITQIPEAIAQLTNLTTLSLDSNQITQIPEAIAQLTNLTTLHLDSNQITEIPEAIAQLTNLTALDLSGNQITQIPEAIAQLTNLKELSLQSNQITQIPEAIAQLTNLTYLSLYNNQITQIPEAIGQLTNLTQLYLWSNQITQIPKAIGQLTNLTTLYLFSNQITEIPEAIGQLTNLKTLLLDSNQITQIPEAIAQLTNLTTLFLDDNQITQIPEAIAQLTNLTTLYLSSNQITEIPEAIAQLTNLTTLYLGSNRITQIPEAIAQLTNLTTLSLWGNQITQIPEAIAQLTNLTSLDLWGNQITQIPEAIAQLTNLKELRLGSNQITQIPEAIAQLTNLTSLDLENNKIEAFPQVLETLANLTKLDLRRNPLPISPEVLGSPDVSQNPGSVEGIFNYCRQLRSGAVRPLNEAKLLLIGQGSVGKTSLINRLIENQFNVNQPQTDGLNLRPWNIRVNSKDVRLNVWDFGGQEIYHATHQFFLTKRSLYLLVCNCRTSEDENRIEYWLKLIESFGGKSPVIIVGNKKDEQPLDINRKALLTKYPNIAAILETSCQTNDGIDELRQAITKEVSQLSEVYNLLPLSWFEVKEQLEQLDQDFISYSQYVGICATKTITEEQNQEQLISLLHNLGLVLNFRNHPILQNTNVLNPDWVTQGIYAILSDERLKTKTKGMLTHADLSNILDPNTYPANRHHYLTELMIEFQLCFRLDCSTPTFLIPGLLPKEEPQETNLDGDILEFQYHYRVLPESIVSRFIVLLHDKIYNNTYWRSGVMLAYTEGTESYNIARIRADLEDKKISIAISDRPSTRRSFLMMIRDVFNKIHNSFGNLDVSERVPVPDHPDHPPLDYQELLGLEAMGITDYPIGKLGIKVNVRQLLDGYESVEARQRHRMGDREFERMEKEMGDRFNIHFHNTNQQGDYKPVSDNTNNLQGAKIGNFANEVKDNARQQANQHIHSATNQTLAQAATEIKALLNQLDKEYDNSTATGQAMITAKAIESIEKNATLKTRIINALAAGGTTALETAVDHPMVKPVVAMIKGFMDAK